MRLSLLMVAILVMAAVASAKKIPDTNFKTRNMRAIPDFLGPTKRKVPRTTPVGARPPTSRQDDIECPSENPCDSKVVGGQEACPHQFPWLALVLCDNPGWLCTGSFIDENHVLTAGHCVSGCTEFSVYGGVHDRSQFDENVQEFKISDPTGHAFESDDYNSGLLTHDFGLIPLNRPAVFNDVVKPICLAPNNGETYNDQYATVTGWGLTSDQSSFAPNVPSFARDRPIISNQECAQTYISAASPSVMCIDTTDATGVCSGDSGGPLNLQSNGAQGAAGPFTQVGVTSFVHIDGCESGNPHGFARVSDFVDELEVRTGKKF